MCVCVFVCLNVFFLCPWLFLSWKKGRRSRTSVFSPEYKLTRLVSQIGWPSYYHFSQKGNQPQFRKLQCTITLIFEETRNVALKIGAMIRSVKFLFPEVALFSTYVPYDHAWIAVVWCWLVPRVDIWDY